MKIVAIGLSHNEADVVQECVKDALSWCDAFVLYDSSTDGTDQLARQAGAIVIPGDPNETFNNGLRQYTLDYVGKLNPDWIVRIDPDEFYPRGWHFQGQKPQDPRVFFKRWDNLGYLAARAHVVQFWITLDDVCRGLLLEDDAVSVQKRRRWYTVGHTAVVAWRHNPVLQYRYDVIKNIPFYPDGRDVGAVKCAGPRLIQTHYTCRSLPQLIARVEDRKKDRMAFGKYFHNLIIDETVGLHKRVNDTLATRVNHDVIYRWFEASHALYADRVERELQ